MHVAETFVPILASGNLVSYLSGSSLRCGTEYVLPPFTLSSTDSTRFPSDRPWITSSVRESLHDAYTIEMVPSLNPVRLFFVSQSMFYGVAFPFVFFILPRIPLNISGSGNCAKHISPSIGKYIVVEQDPICTPPGWRPLPFPKTQQGSCMWFSYPSSPSLQSLQSSSDCGQGKFRETDGRRMTILSLLAW